MINISEIYKIPINLYDMYILSFSYQPVYFLIHITPLTILLVMSYSLMVKKKGTFFLIRHFVERWNRTLYFLKKNFAYIFLLFDILKQNDIHLLPPLNRGKITVFQRYIHN